VEQTTTKKGCGAGDWQKSSGLLDALAAARNSEFPSDLKQNAVCASTCLPLFLPVLPQGRPTPREAADR
jgi:hypothetical protein